MVKSCAFNKFISLLVSFKASTTRDCLSKKRWGRKDSNLKHEKYSKFSFFFFFNSRNSDLWRTCYKERGQLDRFMRRESQRRKSMQRSSFGDCQSTPRQWGQKPTWSACPLSHAASLPPPRKAPALMPCFLPILQGAPVPLLRLACPGSSPGLRHKATSPAKVSWFPDAFTSPRQREVFHKLQSL